MNELIEGLAALLDRGIVVERVIYVEANGAETPTFRIRLADVEETEQVAPGIAGEITRAW